VRQFFPDYTDAEVANMVTYVESQGLNYQEGSAFIIEMIRRGTDKYISDNLKEVGMANVENDRIANEIAAKTQEANDFYQRGLLEEAKLSREQVAVLQRERNALDKYIAEMQNQVATLGLQISERAYGASLGAHPVNTVEFELWQRAGGQVGPIEIPEAPVPVAPTVPGAQAVPTAPVVPTVPGAQGGMAIYSPNRSQTARPGELHTTGEEGWEYLKPGPGTVVAPRAQGETQPTQAGGQRAISQQLGQRPQGGSVSAFKPPSAKSKGRVPYRWLERLQARKPNVPGMQGGGLVPGEGTHTDEEMAAWLASSIQGWPSLYNPNLRGEGQFGSQIPGPQEMSRRTYYSMDPSQQSRLTSFLEAGLKMPSGAMSQGIAEDWLRQMSRSWIPGLEGAKKAVTYAY